MLFLLFGCVPHDTGVEPPPPEACDCERPDARPFQPAEDGGFDDWAGTALGWGVDPDHQRTLIAALRFLLPASQATMAPTCDDPGETWDGWYADVPPSAMDAVERWPILAAGLMTNAGVHGLPLDGAAILLEGDPTVAEPERIWVATDGNMTLTRGEGQDQLQGSLTFVAAGVELGDTLDVVCDEGFRLQGIDLSWVSTGED